MGNMKPSLLLLLCLVAATLASSELDELVNEGEKFSGSVPPPTHDEDVVLFKPINPGDQQKMEVRKKTPDDKKTAAIKTDVKTTATKPDRKIGTAKPDGKLTAKKTDSKIPNVKNGGKTAAIQTDGKMPASKPDDKSTTLKKDSKILNAATNNAKKTMVKQNSKDSQTKAKITENLNANLNKPGSKSPAKKEDASKKVANVRPTGNKVAKTGASDKSKNATKPIDIKQKKNTSLRKSILNTAVAKNVTEHLNNVQTTTPAAAANKTAQPPKK